MTVSMWIKKKVAPVAEDEPEFSRATERDAAPYTWLDIPADVGSRKPEEDGDCIAIDFADIDHIPTLHDAVEQSFEFTHDDSDSDPVNDSALWEHASDLLELPPSAVTPDADANADAAVPIDGVGLDHHDSDAPASADQHSASSHPPMTSMEDFFNPARYEPAQLQRGLLVLAFAFQGIAVAALWKAIDDRVIAMALVPPVVYSCIGIAAYLLGMRYLRIHFAQVRVSDKDWLQCEQVVVAADNGVMLKARFGTAYLIWEQLLGVAQDNDYYYLLIEPNQGFKVPKKGVNDPVLQVKLDDMASLTRASALQGS